MKIIAIIELKINKYLLLKNAIELHNPIPQIHVDICRLTFNIDHNFDYQEFELVFIHSAYIKHF